MQKVIVFGRGNFYQNVKLELHSRYSVAAFLDNKIKRGQKEYVEDLKVYVYNPAEIEKAGEFPVIIMTKYFWEPCQQLVETGVEGHRILFGVELFPVSWNEKFTFLGKEYLTVENGKLVFTSDSERIVLNSQEEYSCHIKKYAEKKYREKYPYINMIADMPSVPASRTFGAERGKPIDRYYIEKFLYENKQRICGETLEIAETTYSIQYGEDRLGHAYMLHVEGWGEDAIKGNLETGEGIEEYRYDTLVITQTLMFTYDLKSVAKNIYRALKRGGTALITVSGISQISRYDADRWGSYYSFHEDALHRLFEPLFGQGNVRVESYGNVKTAVAMLYGLCCEDLVVDDFETNDEDYPVIIGAVLKKE